MTDRSETQALDEAGVERAVAEVQGTMDRLDTSLMQVPRHPLASPFGPDAVDVPFMVRRILRAYFNSTPTVMRGTLTGDHYLSRGAEFGSHPQPKESLDSTSTTN